MVDMARPRGHRLSAPAFDFAANAAGLNITELAERSGLQRATISGLLGGHHRASITKIAALSDALGCPPAMLFPTLIPAFAEIDDCEVAA